MVTQLLRKVSSRVSSLQHKSPAAIHIKPKRKFITKTKEKVEGARKIWGTMKATTPAAVCSTLVW